MKVLIYSTKSTFSGKSYGGAESSLTLLAKRLEELGNTVCFVTSPSKERVSKGKIFYKNGIAIHFVPVLRLPFQRFEKIRLLSLSLNNYLIRSYLQTRFSDFDLAHC
jgi:hypothetical protein